MSKSAAERTEGSTVDSAEIARFAASAASWWDPNGEFRPLHQLNPIRLTFIRDRLAAHFGRDIRATKPFAGLRLLDIGCGGGLVSEPMARLGAAVTGIDAAGQALAVARAHAAGAGLDIDYREAAAEDLAAAGESFDAVLALEIVEHVTDPALFLAAAARLVRPGGGFVAATLNRTPKAFLFGIVGAEYLLRWLPRGTHQWRKFLRPSELAAGLRPHGLAAKEISGVSYNPLARRWALSRDLDVNYLLFAAKA
ncbi:MAG TPA: bifunctional 2-polyprenyl-6-hydroxyphenol methylase/3-demethylubiquinol 3-O-methyltransferase UbiG [Stellaceae bacterium]|nr:bifunctional 2-polyprenyl-6-hydroxyphenol methylase/3-demethylubiquinol 3-O-methyltransferase UbiG [Stellaceae bacterium]